MTLLPEIRGQLESAVRDRAQTTTPADSKSRRRGWPGGFAVVASVLVIAGIVAVIVAFSHHSGSTTPAGPDRGGSVPHRWVQWSRDAYTQTNRHDPACRPRHPTGPNHTYDGRPPRPLTDLLRILHQPATGARRVSLRQLHDNLPADGVRTIRGIYLRYVQRGLQNGVNYYLVPAANVSDLRPAPERCYRQELAAFRQRADRLPSTQAQAASRFEQEQILDQRRNTRGPGVCLILQSTFGRGINCVTAAALQANRRAAVDISDNGHGTVTAIVAPNSVRSITARYPTQTRPGRVPHPVTTTETLTNNNVAIFLLRGAWDPPKLTFHGDTEGTMRETNTVRATTTAQPPPGSAFCKQNPNACDGITHIRTDTTTSP
jgi:hypothetical protein